MSEHHEEVPSYIDAAMGARFRLDKPPGIYVDTLHQDSIAFTRLQTDRSGHGRTMPVPPDDAFAFQVMLKPLQETDVWRNGRHSKVAGAAPGDTFTFNLAENPMVAMHAPFDTMRFYISKRALDELSRENGSGAVGSLAYLPWGQNDNVLHGLALALAATLDKPNEGTTMFAEQIALAFHTHVANAYARKQVSDRNRGGLAPWQLRKACEIMRARLQDDPSIAELASACGLSTGHFARAFRLTTGIPPHQWLMQQRLERSRALMKNGKMPLAEIALACGFVDQSHFSRVFARKEGSSPGKWRRELAA